MVQAEIVIKSPYYQSAVDGRAYSISYIFVSYFKNGIALKVFNFRSKGLKENTQTQKQKILPPPPPSVNVIKAQLRLSFKGQIFAQLLRRTKKFPLLIL